MHDETTSGPGYELDPLQLTLLELLLTDESPGLWSHDEIARALGDPVIAIDAADALHAVGFFTESGTSCFRLVPLRGTGG
jgi:hypothetical protein